VNARHLIPAAPVHQILVGQTIADRPKYLQAAEVGRCVLGRVAVECPCREDSRSAGTAP
jgi:hypothetical protein